MADALDDLLDGSGLESETPAAAEAPRDVHVSDAPRIDRPGCYTNIPLDDYHGHKEICPGFSVSGTGLKMVADCPIKFWHASPLNPNRPEPEPPSRPLNFGAAMHDAIALGADWKQKWITTPPGFSERFTSKFADFLPGYYAALKAGRRPLKQEDATRIDAMLGVLKQHELSVALYADGMVEPALSWQDEETGIWIRARPDFLPSAHRVIPDYKTAVSASPEDFSKAISNHRYHWSAALVLEGIRQLWGTETEKFVFIVQEKEPPFVVQIIQVDPYALAWARVEIRMALRKLAELLPKPPEEWPGYGQEIECVGLPPWETKRLESSAEVGIVDYPKSNII